MLWLVRGCGRDRELHSLPARGWAGLWVPKGKSESEKVGERRGEREWVRVGLRKRGERESARERTEGGRMSMRVRGRDGRWQFLCGGEYCREFS